MLSSSVHVVLVHYQFVVSFPDFLSPFTSPKADENFSHLNPFAEKE